MKNYLLILPVLLSLSVNAQPNKFVNISATGTGSGNNWQDAYTSLQSALSSAQPGNQIWVAKGVYRPGDSRDNTFLLNSGISIYGGFAGTETQLSQRNPLTNPTVLSGDIGVENLASDNVYHVLSFSGGDLAPGVYFLQVVDENGRVKTEKTGVF